MFPSDYTLVMCVSLGVGIIVGVGGCVLAVWLYVRAGELE